MNRAHAGNVPQRTMTFDDDNRLATFNGQNVTNDLDGNLTWGSGTSDTFVAFGFDSRNRLTNVAGTTYTSDPAGNRVALSNATGLTRFVVNPNSALSQILLRVKNGVRIGVSP